MFIFVDETVKVQLLLSRTTDHLPIHTVQLGYGHKGTYFIFVDETV